MASSFSNTCIVLGCSVLALSSTDEGSNFGQNAFGINSVSALTLKRNGQGGAEKKRVAAWAYVGAQAPRTGPSKDFMKDEKYYEDQLQVFDERSEAARRKHKQSQRERVIELVEAGVPLATGSEITDLASPAADSHYSEWLIAEQGRVTDFEKGLEVWDTKQNGRYLAQISEEAYERATRMAKAKKLTRKDHQESRARLYAVAGNSARQREPAAGSFARRLVPASEARARTCKTFRPHSAPSAPSSKPSARGQRRVSLPLLRASGGKSEGVRPQPPSTRRARPPVAARVGRSHKGGRRVVSRSASG